MNMKKQSKRRLAKCDQILRHYELSTKSEIHTRNIRNCTTNIVNASNILKT